MLTSERACSISPSRTEPMAHFCLIAVCLLLSPLVVRGQDTSSPYHVGFGAGVGSIEYSGAKTVVSPYLLAYRTPFAWGGFGVRGGFDLYKEDADDRYYIEPIDMRCIDSVERQYASARFCDAAANYIEAFVQAEALARIYRGYGRAYLTAGARLLPKVIPYGGARYMLMGGVLEIGLEAGPGFLFAGVSLRFAEFDS